MAQLSEAELVGQAVLDAYGDDEQLTGFYTMIEGNLALPFTTMVLGLEATVEGVDLTDSGIVAICAREGHRQAIPRHPAPGACSARLGMDRRVPALGGRAVSEYQYYEFLALDRPLTTDEPLPPQACLLHGPSWPNWRSSDPRSALASVSDRPRRACDARRGIFAH